MQHTTQVTTACTQEVDRAKAEVTRAHIEAEHTRTAERDTRAQAEQAAAAERESLHGSGHRCGLQHHDSLLLTALAPELWRPKLHLFH